MASEVKRPPWFAAGRLLRTVFAALALASGGIPAWAQQVTFVVPYAAGGPTDVTARLLAERMGRSIGRTIIVENVAGAGGTIGPSRVARSSPDGATVLIHHNALPAAPALYANLPFDVRTAFEPVGLINVGPMVLVGRKSLEAKTAQELAGWIKSQGEKVNFAHAGAGTSQHLCTVLLGSALGVKPSFVSYRGAAPAMTDLIGGQIDLICDQAANAVPQVQSDTVRAYAVTSKERLPSLPDVPTTAEVGLPGVDYTVWHGLYVVKGTPPPVIGKLNEALRTALADPVLQARFAELGTVVVPPSDQSPEAHRQLFSREIDRLARLVSAAGIGSGNP